MKKMKVILFCILFSTFMISNCYDSQVSSDDNYTYEITDCKSQAMGNIGEPEEDAVLNEELIWKYDADSKKLNITHTNIKFNCEIDFLAEINYNNETKTYEIIEKNVSTLMARCYCFYDGNYTINNVKSGNITLKLTGG